MGKQEQKCGTCAFWQKTNIGEGLCRRLPPTPMLAGPNIVAVFPGLADKGWCGEWKLSGTLTPVVAEPEPADEVRVTPGPVILGGES